jgi:thioesterase domain-containing protein
MNFEARGYAPCVLIRDVKGADATAYCIPGAGGSVFCFLPFANAIDIPLNILGLQPRGLDDAEGPHRSVEDAAACFVEAMLKRQRGPFRLMGHSFGGWVVFEVAARLLRLGFDVMPILLLDSAPPMRRDSPTGLLSQTEVLRRYVRILEQAAGRTSALSAAELSDASATHGIGELLQRLKICGLLPRNLAASMFARVFRTFEVHVNTSYVPAQLPVDVYLIQASERDPLDEDHIPVELAVAQWKQVAPRLRSTMIPGNHMTLLESPHVEEIAKLARDVWS